MRKSEIEKLLVPFLKDVANAIREKGAATGTFPAYEDPAKIRTIGGGGALYLHNMTAFDFGDANKHMMPLPEEQGGHGAMFVISTRSTSYAGQRAQFVADLESGAIKAIEFKRVVIGERYHDQWDGWIFNHSGTPYVSYENGKVKICYHSAYNGNAAGNQVITDLAFTSSVNYYTGFDIGTITTDAVTTL